MRPVQLDDLVRELTGGHHLWRCPGTLGVLQTDVHQRKQQRVFVGGRVAAFVEQLEDLALPRAEDLARLADRFPEAFVEILVKEGENLSDELQDDESYRYALVDLCAEDRKDLLKKFDEANTLLPFGFEPIPRAR